MPHENDPVTTDPTADQVVATGELASEPDPARAPEGEYVAPEPQPAQVPPPAFPDQPDPRDPVDLEEAEKLRAERENPQTSATDRLDSTG